MESVVFDDSPLATYLEGQGEASPSLDQERHAESSPATHADVIQSFAPPKTSTAYASYRKRIPKALKLHVRSTSESLSRLQHVLSGVVKGQLGHRENGAFLERFRYTIVASDLLTEHHQGHHAYHKPPGSLHTEPPAGSATSKPVFSTVGAFGIAGAAFVLTASVAWARSLSESTTFPRLLLFGLLAAIGLGALYSFVGRKWLQHIRAQANDGLQTLVSNAQAFDAALSTTLTIVQEVELVARGYRLSNPLPPVSRIDDQGQQRKCSRLRSTARAAISDLLQPLAVAARSLEQYAENSDLERYHDIYEITRADVDEMEQMSWGGYLEEDSESLKAIKIRTQQLFLARKLFLCNLLAINADGSRSDLNRWTTVLHSLQNISSRYVGAAVSLDSLLSDDERFAASATPKVPLTPSRERARTQIRKLGGLSSGIRGLQAKMVLLREEADRSLDFSEDGGELGSNLLAQYDAIGSDLKSLIQEWEEGRLALTSSHNKRRSISSAGLLSPRAQTPTSLSGSTAIGESPADAFRVLSGESLSPRLEATSSDEEIFEAVAMPRQRTSLTREERVARMREERDQREKARENRQASTNMLRELETVLKHKPQTSKAARRVTVM